MKIRLTKLMVRGWTIEIEAEGTLLDLEDLAIVASIIEHGLGNPTSWMEKKSETPETTL